MNRRQLAVLALAGAAAAGSGPALAAKPARTWDNLVLVKSKKLDLVYLIPGADLRGYKQVMVDPTEVAFRKNWQRDYNNAAMGLGGRVSDQTMRETIERGADVATGIFAEQFAAAGYPAATAPGPDVLRVRTGVINISVNAPDVRTSARSRSFAGEAGDATMVVEVRDSQTGALLGRAVDRRLAGDTGALIRNSMTNRSDFRRLVKTWAERSAEGLNELKALSPIDEAGLTKK
jgi:hypothetical protein